MTRFLQDIPKPIWIFSTIWFILGCLQAGLMELHPDEAYYWQMSRFMDWGYFHQPPMVAVFIKAGYALFQNELGVRLVTVICSSIGVLLLFKLSETKDYKTFLFIYLGMVLSHAGVFMAVPDSPLIFFTLVFLALLKKYLESDTLATAIGLGIIAAALMYSKYHSVVLFGSVLLAQPKLLLRKSFWITVIVGVALFTPHILWQFDNDLVSFKYHWLRRNKAGWEPLLVLNYVGSQLLLFGPLGLLLLYYILKKGLTSSFERVLLFVMAGFIGFFLILSFRGRVEANWTASAFVPLIILGTKALASNKTNRYFKPLSIGTAIVLIAARIYLITPVAGKGLNVNFPFSGWSNWAEAIKTKADSRPVFFSASYQLASEYSFYSGEQGFHFGPANYDGNQFELWNIDTAAFDKPIALVLPIGEDPKKAVSVDGFQTYYMYDIPAYHSYRNVRFDLEGEDRVSEANQVFELNTTISNHSTETIDLKKLTGERPIKVIFYIKGQYHPAQFVACPDCIGVLRSGESKPVSFAFKSPPVSGDYLIRFGFDFDLGMPEQNSEFVKFKVIGE
ncbi:MAG: hypothetical protein ACJATS_001188 [Psychroserpens sp.]|jgi:hypothetical protein